MQNDVVGGLVFFTEMIQEATRAGVALAINDCFGGKK